MIAQGRTILIPNSVGYFPLIPFSEDFPVYTLAPFEHKSKRNHMRGIFIERFMSRDVFFPIVHRLLNPHFVHLIRCSSNWKSLHLSKVSSKFGKTLQLPAKISSTTSLMNLDRTTPTNPIYRRNSRFMRRQRKKQLRGT